GADRWHRRSALGDAGAVWRSRAAGAGRQRAPAALAVLPATARCRRGGARPCRRSGGVDGGAAALGPLWAIALLTALLTLGSRAPKPRRCSPESPSFSSFSWWFLPPGMW